MKEPGDETMKVQAYLFFEGRCEEAVNFYCESIGAERSVMMRFKESPDPNACNMIAPGWEEKIMHGEIRIGESTVLVSDGMREEGAGFKGFMLCIDAPSEAEAERLFAVLGEGGQVQMPMGETFFANRFGMVSDRFGMHWAIIAGEKN